MGRDAREQSPREANSATFFVVPIWVYARFTTLGSFTTEYLCRLFTISIPNGDFDRIATLDERHFQGFYHQETVPGLINIVYFLVMHEHLFTD